MGFRPNAWMMSGRSRSKSWRRCLIWRPTSQGLSEPRAKGVSMTRTPSSASAPDARAATMTSKPSACARCNRPRKCERTNQSSVAKAFAEFDDDGRMKPSAFYERVVDVMEELVKFTLLTRDVAPYLVDRYSERRESAEQLAKRVNQRSL